MDVVRRVKLRDLISTFKGMAPFLAQDSHVKAWISCSINIRDDYCLSSSKKLGTEIDLCLCMRKRRVNFMNFVELFLTEIIMNLLGSRGFVHPTSRHD